MASGLETRPERRSRKSDEIRPGDRMAIKRLIRRGSPSVAIHAIGVVEKTERHAALPIRTIYVRWIRLPENRKVPFSGYAGTIYGPFLDEQRQRSDRTNLSALMGVMPRLSGSWQALP